MKDSDMSKDMEGGQNISGSLITETKIEEAATYSVPSILSNLAKLLPTGVLFVFQAFSNLIASEDSCARWNKIFVGCFLGILGIASFVLTLTDTFTDDSTAKVKVHYGIATTGGLTTVSSSKNKVKPSNEHEYRLKLMDLLHAALAVVVFAVFALTDKNIVNCLYPSAEKNINKLLQALPLVVSVLTCVIFTVFPSRRQGISHPITKTK